MRISWQNRNGYIPNCMGTMRFNQNKDVLPVTYFFILKKL